MSAMTKREWMAYIEKTWDAAQKEAWSEPEFECPRCGHCCKSDLARVGEVGVWGECEPQEALEDGWCNWVCPKPRGYLMQCCDCELIHEVDFRVVRYESEDSEVYEVVDDPDLQAQMRLRRRDDISPKKPQQEPVAWISEGGDVSRSKRYMDEMGFKCNPLYTAPPKREWVSEALRLADALDAEFVQGRISNSTGRESAVELRRLHEVNQDLLKALHEALETKQEPVAWISDSPTKGNGKQLHWTKAEAWRWSSNITPLYTAPPKREWVGLTDGEIDILSCEMVKGDKSVNWLCKVLEAKLREKNHG